MKMQESISKGVNTLTDTGIKPAVLRDIQEFARKYHIRKVILFGSRARGDYRRTSDIDLATQGGSHARFAVDVDELSSTLLKFDFVDLDGSVQPELLKSIEQEGIVIYEEI